MNASASNINKTTCPSYAALSAALVALALLGSTGAAAACSLNIGSGTTLTISSGTVTTDCVDVAAGGKIVITGSGTLILNGSGGNDESTIDGRIILESCTSVLRISHNDHTFTGDGKIVGECNTAQIAIDSGLTLTSNITIEGALQVRAASATFINGATGVVHANRTSGDQILTLYSGTFDDVDGAEWKVSADGSAELYFRSGITVGTLDGDFTVNNGVLDLDVSVTTDGCLGFTGGQIQVAPSCRFTVDCTN